MLSLYVFLRNAIRRLPVFVSRQLKSVWPTTPRQSARTQSPVIKRPALRRLIVLVTTLTTLLVCLALFTSSPNHAVSSRGPPLKAGCIEFVTTHGKELDGTFSSMLSDVLLPIAAYVRAGCAQNHLILTPQDARRLVPVHRTTHATASGLLCLQWRLRRSRQISRFKADKLSPALRVCARSR
jgi:hypothetical protein